MPSRRATVIVGQSSDDNVSGMNFSRRGLDELTAAVDADKIDAVLVKGFVTTWSPQDPDRTVY